MVSLVQDQWNNCVFLKHSSYFIHYLMLRFYLNTKYVLFTTKAHRLKSGSHCINSLNIPIETNKKTSSARKYFFHGVLHQGSTLMHMFYKFVES